MAGREVFDDVQALEAAGQLDLSYVCTRNEGFSAPPMLVCACVAHTSPLFMQIRTSEAWKRQDPR